MTGVPKPDAAFKAGLGKMPAKRQVRQEATGISTRSGDAAPDRPEVAPDTAQWFNSLPQLQRMVVMRLADKYGLQGARDIFMRTKGGPEVDMSSPPAQDAGPAPSLAGPDDAGGDEPATADDRFKKLLAQRAALRGS